MVRAGAGHDEFLLNDFHAKLMACQAGMQEAARLGMTRVCMERDATLVKTSLMVISYRLSAVIGIIMEMKHLMNSEFVPCRISVCKRDCTHNLAASGCTFPSG